MEARGRFGKQDFVYLADETACTLSLRFFRAREAEPSAARRILAERLERSAGDFCLRNSFWFNRRRRAAAERG
jgi:hypothetical protein